MVGWSVVGALGRWSVGRWSVVGSLLVGGFKKTQSKTFKRSFTAHLGAVQKLRNTVIVGRSS